MNSLLGIFKKSPKGDAFRPAESPEQYNDGIAKLNSLGDNQYDKINTQTINRINKNGSIAASTSTNKSAILPSGVK